MHRESGATASWESKNTSEAEMKALGISQAGRPFELNVSMILWKIYGLGAMAETTEGERTLWISTLALEGAENLVYSCGATVPLNLHSTLPGRTSHEGTAYHGKNILFNKQWMENGVPQPTSSQGSTSHLTKQCAYLHQRSTPCLPAHCPRNHRFYLGSSSAPTCIPVCF